MIADLSNASLPSSLVVLGMGGELMADWDVGLF